MRGLLKVGGMRGAEAAFGWRKGRRSREKKSSAFDWGHGTCAGGHTIGVTSSIRSSVSDFMCRSLIYLDLSYVQ